MPVITTSLFSLFKIGPGPSSSHTIGPMSAGKNFIDECKILPRDILAEAASIKIHLFGSLSATGKGHGTDCAVLAGLLGEKPEHCPVGFLTKLSLHPEEKYILEIGDGSFFITLRDIIFDSVIHSYPYNNALKAELLSADGKVLFQRVYYSVGGGFIHWEGEKAPEVGEPVYPYSNFTELGNILHDTGLTIYELMIANEMAITGASRISIINHIKECIESMEESVKHGLNAAGFLPGPLHVERKAGMLYQRSRELHNVPAKALTALNAYAFAAAEENASGGVIVTAPTCGSAGVMPALVYAMRHDMFIGDRAILSGFLAAAAVGFAAKQNASIAGAEVGCQGEIGVASAMAAALLSETGGNTFPYVENAAEIALEHHLGITCDPVGGYVQIPCIERNGMGAVKAYNAFLLSRGMRPESHRVSLDAAIFAMAETGKEMNNKFKETSLGGLAVSVVSC